MKVALTVIASVFFFAVAAIGCDRSQSAMSDGDRRKCADAILDAIRKTSSRDAAQAYVRSDPYSRSVCKEFEMNGVPVIP
ncbi:hypothetical protein [Caenimonas soli]|uniref:hypothetical protein n=1 Tax=Caenimonas soli TaxID=2735555 RepID=UPI0015571C2D|nr:hypothetical protein [Caenimonas soli]NPC59340.1 hypothetical protein [Caenimonas soli]